MRKLRLFWSVLILVLASLSLLGLAVSIRIITDGLQRFPTVARFQNAREAWNKGQGIQAAKEVAQASWMTVDGGVRWQAAKYYLAQSASFKHNDQMREATQACGRANDVLGQYDNGWEIDYYCDWLVWDLDAP